MTFRKPAAPFEPEDLSIRARRGELTPEQQVSFERALDASATLRVAHLVGRDFDDARQVRAGDDEIILRASVRALARKRPARPGTRRWAALLAAATLCFASVAAATWIATTRSKEPALAPAPALATSPPASTPAPARARKSPPAPELVVEDAELAAPAVSAPPPAPRRSDVGTAATGPATTSEKTPAALFRQANGARRAGDFQSARALYGELQKSFPGSSEARVSLVSLGKLLLGSGNAREAERQFRLYLTTGGGDLREEALVGRANALARLGQSGEERRVWQELQRNHPRSVYAERARQRLDELDAREQGRAREP